MLPQPVKTAKMANLAWFLVWGGLSTVWCWSAAFAIGPTFDEPWYLQAGLYNWHHLYHRELLTQGTMPLPAEVQTVPLLVSELVGAEPGHNSLAWLPIARMTSIVFWWLLLWAVYRLGTFYGGTAWAGRLALAMVACEPLLLGHASLAATDVPFTACLLALVVAFRTRRERPGWPGRLLPAVVWCALSFLAKASALMFVPVCLFAVEMERLWRAGWRPGRCLESWKPAVRSFRDLAVVGGLGVVLLLAVCPRAPRGLLFQIRHNMEETGGSFLLGHVSPNGYWYYFAVALAIKLSLPVLVLVGTALVVRRARVLNGASCAALALLALTPTFHVQIGVRYVLPVAVLAVVGAMAALASWKSEQQPGKWRWLVTGFTAALVIWSVLNACLTWPNGLCFNNELWGGTGKGYLALSDSNYDWGQGIKELTDWHEREQRHAEKRIRLWYFGTDPNAAREPFEPLAVDKLSSGEELERVCADSYLAVSTTLLYGGSMDVPAARYLRSRQPCERTTTFLIYDFTPPVAAARRR